jgi:hypothetical protein
MLFEVNDIPTSRLSSVDEPGEHAAGDARFIVGTHGTDLHQLVGDLVQNEHVHLVSEGAWSFHEIVAYAARQTGPAHLLFTTWTITEGPMRVLAGMKDRGALLSMNCILDSRVEKYNSVGYQLAREVMPTLKLMHIHGKCAVLLNDAHGVAIHSTANMTRNRRTEFYAISTHRNVAEARHRWITGKINGAATG